jgi:hypothetical protein
MIGLLGIMVKMMRSSEGIGKSRNGGKEKKMLAFGLEKNFRIERLSKCL